MLGEGKVTSAGLNRFFGTLRKIRATRSNDKALFRALANVVKAERSKETGLRRKIRRLKRKLSKAARAAREERKRARKTIVRLKAQLDATKSKTWARKAKESTTKVVAANERTAKANAAETASKKKMAERKRKQLEVAGKHASREKQGKSQARIRRAKSQARERSTKAQEQASKATAARVREAQAKRNALFRKRKARKKSTKKTSAGPARYLPYSPSAWSKHMRGHTSGGTLAGDKTTAFDCETVRTAFFRYLSRRRFRENTLFKVPSSAAAYKGEKRYATEMCSSCSKGRVFIPLWALSKAGRCQKPSAAVETMCSTILGGSGAPTDKQDASPGARSKLCTK